MIGSFTEYWKYTWPEVWSILARSRRAPRDLFITLYRTAIDPPQDMNAKSSFELIVNDSEQAQNAFERLRPQDIGDEPAVIRFVEAAFAAIQEFDIPTLPRLYRYLFRAFLKKYNLRYRIINPFRINLVLPGVFASFYNDLIRLNRTDSHLDELMTDFEAAFSGYSRSFERHELKNCITNAFIYAEGVASKTCGTSKKTLSELCDALQLWPHPAVKESLKKLYGFRGDYSGLGHGNKSAGKLRELEPRDAVLVCLLVLSFTGYLTNDHQVEQGLSLTTS